MKSIKSIVMDPQSVRLLLAGRKTQFRRVVKTALAGQDQISRSPYGVVGDRHRVKETFRYEGWDMDGAVQVTYDADGEHAPIHNVEYRGRDFDIWTERQCDRFRRSGAIESDDGDRIVMPDGVRPPRYPSMHMPHWASRITLTITDVRVQRVQDITAEDAMAEGARRFDDIPDPHPYRDGSRWSMGSPTSTTQCLGSARMAFANLFDGTHGLGTWERNPWVWAVSFQVVK